MSLDLNAIRNRAERVRCVPEGPNALLRAIDSADDVPDLLAEVERLTLLNSRLDADNAQLAGENLTLTEQLAAATLERP